MQLDIVKRNLYKYSKRIPVNMCPLIMHAGKQGDRQADIRTDTARQMLEMWFWSLCKPAPTDAKTESY